jgi:hypothetical protein
LLPPLTDTAFKVLSSGSLCQPITVEWSVSLVATPSHRTNNRVGVRLYLQIISSSNSCPTHVNPRTNNRVGVRLCPPIILNFIPPRTSTPEPIIVSVSVSVPSSSRLQFLFPLRLFPGYGNNGSWLQLYNAISGANGIIPTSEETGCCSRQYRDMPAAKHRRENRQRALSSVEIQDLMCQMEQCIKSDFNSIAAGIVSRT